MEDIITYELAAFLAAFMAIFAIIFLAIYIYTSLAFQRIAKKTRTPHPWLAWIPIANLYLYSQIAGMHWWPVLLVIGLFIPYINFLAAIVLIVYNFIWLWKIFEKVKQPGWWAILSLIWPIFLIFLGIAAWSGEKEIEQISYRKQTPQNYQKPTPKKSAKPERIQRIDKLKGSFSK
jgi:hypothetical protein